MKLNIEKFYSELDACKVRKPLRKQAIVTVLHVIDEINNMDEHESRLHDYSLSEYEIDSHFAKLLMPKAVKFKCEYGFSDILVKESVEYADVSPAEFKDAQNHVLSRFKTQANFSSVTQVRKEISLDEHVLENLQDGNGIRWDGSSFIIYPIQTLPGLTDDAYLALQSDARDYKAKTESIESEIIRKFVSELI